MKRLLLNIKKGISLVALASLLISFRPVAAAPAYGNQTAQEYGDAVYKEFVVPIVNYNYNHVGIFAGFNSFTDSWNVVQAMQPGETTQEVSFIDIFITPPTPAAYYGAYTLDNHTLTFTERKNIVLTGELLVAQAIPYPSYLTLNALEYYGSTFDGSITDISAVRCDGFAEYVYEANALRVWRNTSYADNQWSIVLYPDNHNDVPDLTRNPDTELSPWSQRGAPPSTGPFDLLGYEYVGPPWPDTHMTQPAVVNMPHVEVTQAQGNGYVDVTMTATDESGINQFYYMLPGSSIWTPGIQQPQHPTSDTYSETVRLSAPGTFYCFAMDNGGNYPPSAPGMIITIPLLYTVTPTPTITHTPASTPTPYFGNPVMFPNPVKEDVPVVLCGFLFLPSDVKVQLYTLGFRKIKEEVILNAPAGSNILLEMKDGWGTSLANGLYYVVVTTNHGHYIKKLLITK